MRGFGRVAGYFGASAPPFVKVFKATFPFTNWMAMVPSLLFQVEVVPEKGPKAHARGVAGLSEDPGHLRLRHAVRDLLEVLLAHARLAGREPDQQAEGERQSKRAAGTLFS